MLTEIGIVAGEIWELLEHEKSIELSDVVRRLPFEEKLTFMALGWLSREGHILFVNKNGIVFIELNKRSEANV